MSHRTDAVVQALFNKASLSDCSLQQVDYLAHQYPYFSTAQWLLLQKTEKESEHYARQWQRTALHFSNPLLLQFNSQPALFDAQLPRTELFQNPIPANETITESEEDTIAEPIEDKQEEHVAIATEAKETISPNSPQTAIEVQATNDTAIVVEKKMEAPALTFEPYHMVDYFASQGIKLSQQEASNDALGKQLKSFTQWLKTMKRLPETAVAQSADAVGEHKVESLAAHSLQPADVVTESMAEVWLKQGNKEKAADVYRKLSLQNPSKSAYFAAKIASLKKT